MRSGSVLEKGTTGIPDGTVTLPSIRFAADQDTGFYKPAAGQLGLGVDATRVALFTATAITVDVPITIDALNVTTITGTAAVNSLTIAGSVTSGAPLQRDLVFRTGNAANPQALATRLTIGSNAATAVITWANSTHTGIVLSAALDGNTFNITNVGFLSGGGTVSSVGVIRLANNLTGRVSWRNFGNDGDVSIYVDTNDRLLVPNLTLSGVVFIADGTIGAPALAFTNDVDTGIYSVAANNLGIVARGSGGAGTGTITLTSISTLAVVIGGLSAANVAASGLVRFPNLASIVWRNNANGADLTLSVGSNDRLTYTGAISGGTNPAVTGAFGIPNATYITARNGANAADIQMIQVSPLDEVQFGAPVAGFTLAGAITGSGSPTIGTVGAITSNAVLTVTAAGINVTGGIGNATAPVANALTAFTTITGAAAVTSLAVNGQVTAGAPLQRDLVFSTGNAANPQVLATRLTIGSNAATAVITWANSTHTGIVLSGTMGANGQTITDLAIAGGLTFTGTEATAGAIRMVNNTSIGWRNAADTANITFGITATNALNAVVATATAPAFQIEDGTTAYYSVDTRTAITGVFIHSWATTAVSFASAIGNSFSLTRLNSFTLTQTGSTGVTAFDGLSLLINSPTVTDAAALTVTTASAVIINGPIPAGLGPVTFTNSFALDLPTFATNGTAAAGLRVAAPTGAVTNSSILLTGTMRSSVAGAGDAFLPTADNAGQIGNATFRWQLIRGVTVTSGDYRFENDFFMTEAERLGLAPGIALCRPDGSLITVFR